MKRIISIAICLLCLFGSASCESIDLSRMTIDELRNLQNQIAAEIAARDLPEGQDVITLTPYMTNTLVNDGGYCIYLTGNFKYDRYGKQVLIEAVCENGSTIAQRTWMEDGKLNGWNTSFPILFPLMKAGEKARDWILVELDDAFLTSPSEIKAFSFVIETEDEDDHHINTYGPFTFKFNDFILWE